MAVMTTHATKRTRKRLGIPKKSAESNAERALLYGVHQEETKGALRRFLDGAAQQHADNMANNVRIYHRSVYVFNDDVLITVFPLRKKYLAAADALEKRHQNNTMEEIEP